VFPAHTTGTYLVERKRVLSDKLIGIEKLPIDWEQVLKVWVVARTALDACHQSQDVAVSASSALYALAERGRRETR
jgi:hypothetical protein